MRDVGSMAVGDIMAKPVFTATPAMRVGEARQLMRAEAIRHLPVLHGELLVGIVSDRDLRGAPDAALPLGTIMTRPVFVLSSDTPIRKAARVFQDRRFGAMPVLRGRDLVGIVSVVDVLRALGE